MRNKLQLDSLYKKLQKYEDFDMDPENYEKFLEIVDEILLRKNPECVEILLNYLIKLENIDFVGEMLLNNILYFIKKHESAVDILARKLPDLLNFSPERCEDLFSIFLNDRANYASFLQMIKKQTQGIKDHLLSLIKSKSPHHTALIEELKKELNN